MNYSNSQRSGAIATMLFHIALFLFLLLMVINLPVPPKEDEGYLVDFGNSNTGLGLQEPSAAMGSEVVSATKAKAAASHPVSKPRPSTKVQDKGDEDLLTQEYEKTVAIAENAKKKKVMSAVLRPLNHEDIVICES